ncbi:MAG: T9SS type A sorting domain-containing protein [Fibromonadales bacterium]|nr:T9SS type A sorting domain-containing protein [Fibromonadales bacterium]
MRLAQGASDCNGGLNTWWQGIECGPAGLDDQLTRPNATPTFDGSGQAILGYCKWPVNDDGSPNTAGDCWPVTTSGEAADCESGEGEWWPGNNWTIGSQTGACPTGPSPIVSGSTVANLNILVQTGSLHISSAREATMQLFDMSGKQVFSQKVPSGYSVVNLKDQKMGVYFAVVTSGSHKQTVKVTLK